MSNQLFFLTIAISIRRAGVASRLSRLQAQTFFKGHEEFLQNKAPVQTYHFECIDHFFRSGKAKAEAADPATLALLLQTSTRPAHIMKPFRCCPVAVSIKKKFALLIIETGW
jgi:hypothetical protein